MFNLLNTKTNKIAVNAIDGKTIEFSSAKKAQQYADKFGPILATTFIVVAA